MVLDRAKRINAHSGNAKRDREELVNLAKNMLAQLATGRHENPLVGILGNPPRGRQLASRVYRIEYRHAQGRHHNYQHAFGPGTVAYCLPDGTILLRHTRGKRLWKDFADVKD